MRFSIFIHTVGFVLWVGSLIILPTFMRGIEKGVDSGAYIVRSLRKAIFGYFLPGLLFTLFTGLHQINRVTFKQGWFHGKLLCILILLASSALLFLEYKNIMREGSVNKKVINFIQISSSVCLVVIAFLTQVMRVV